MRHSKRELRKRKWEHSEEVLAFCAEEKLEVTQFERSKSTPHLRIWGICDYWPATAHFIDFDRKTEGYGYEDFKEYVRMFRRKP